MFYWGAYEGAILFSQHKYPGMGGGSSAFLAGQVPQSSVCSLPLPRQPQHLGSCSPATAEPSAGHPQPSLLLQGQQQHLCRQVRREDFPWPFTLHLFLLYCCVADAGPSEHSLLVESHRLGHLMRPFKVQGLILRQTKSGKKRSLLVIIFHGQSCRVQSRGDSIWPLSEANIAAAHCTALKCFPPKLLRVFGPC